MKIHIFRGTTVLNLFGASVNYYLVGRRYQTMQDIPPPTSQKLVLGTVHPVLYADGSA